MKDELVATALVTVEELARHLQAAEERRAQILEGLGPLMRAARQDAGLTLREVAGAAGVSIVFISEVERGRRPPNLKVLRGLVRALVPKAKARAAGAAALRAHFSDPRTWRRATERMQDSDPFAGFVERAEDSLLRMMRGEPSSFGTDTPWPLRDVLQQLVDAADHLHEHHDCDCHGYEVTRAAVDAARAVLAQNE